MRFSLFLALSLLVTGPVAARDGRSLYNLDAKWRTSDDQTITLASFTGTPVFVAMFYASCATVCPMTVSFMRRIERKLPAGSRARFLLVSFDGSRDSGAVLRTFAEQHHLSAGWTLLAGQADDARDFAATLAIHYRGEANGEITHTSGVFLLDRDGVVRGSSADLSSDGAGLVAAYAALPREMPR